MNTNEGNLSQVPEFEIVKAVRINEFEREMKKDRYTNIMVPSYGFTTKVNIKIKNVIREIELTYVEEWQTEGKPWRGSINSNQKKEIDNKAAEFGVAIDWSDIITEYTVFAEKLRAADLIKMKAGRAEAWDAHWGHAFIGQLKIYLPEAEAKLQPSREHYVDEPDRYSRNVDVRVTYKGQDVSIDKEGTSYKMFTIDCKRYRATKIPTIAGKIANDVNNRINRDKQKEDRKTRFASDFERLKGFFPEFKVEDQYSEGRYRLNLPGVYNRLEFGYSHDNMTNRESFRFNGVDQGVSLAEFSKIVAIFKTAAEAVTSKK
jgi:hypothetical protein